MFDFYRFVNDSRFLGGSTEYSDLNEGSPYWFNGLVPLAFGLGDERIESQVRYYLDYILDAQQSDGWIGAETTQATRGVWARTMILLGLMVSFSCFIYDILRCPSHPKDKNCITSWILT